MKTPFEYWLITAGFFFTLLALSSNENRDRTVMRFFACVTFGAGVLVAALAKWLEMS